MTLIKHPKPYLGSVSCTYPIFKLSGRRNDVHFIMVSIYWSKIHQKGHTKIRRLDSSKSYMQI